MKIKVLKDRQGAVIATFPAEQPKGDRCAFEPVPEEGDRIEEMNVGEDFAADLDGFYQSCNAS